MRHSHDHWRLDVPAHTAMSFWIADHKGLVAAVCGSCAIVVSLVFGSYTPPIAPASPARADTAEWSAMRIDGESYEIDMDDGFRSAIRSIAQEIRRLIGGVTEK